MSSWQTCLLIFFGAGLGANARYWLSLWLADRFGTLFPWGTLAVNSTGSVLIGIFVGTLLGGEPIAHHWRLFLAVGLLGGFTTFSAFSLETVQLLREQHWPWAIGNILSSLLLGTTGCWMGFMAARGLTSSSGIS